MPSTRDAPDAPRKFHRPRKLAVFGAYSDHDLYQRNRTLISLLSELSGDAVELRPPPGESLHGLARGQSLRQRLVQNLSDALHLWSNRQLLDGCDTIFLPYPAYLGLMLLWLGRRLNGRQIIADAFLEMYSTVVEDRALLSDKSLGAKLLLILQRATLGRADLVFIDTPAQAALLRERLGNSTAMVVDLPVGIDERLWQSQPARPLASDPREEPCNVLFWGTFIPLHGAECIAAAAYILESRGEAIELRVIGDGQTAPTFATALEQRPVQNLVWERSLVSSAALAEAISHAHLILGVFGDSSKAASVVPYKIHQSLASNRPVITRASPAMAEAADAEAGLVLCPANDPIALADAIADMALRLRAGWQASTRGIYERQFSNAVMRERLEMLLPANTDDDKPC